MQVLIATVASIIVLCVYSVYIFDEFNKYTQKTFDIQNMYTKLISSQLMELEEKITELDNLIEKLENKNNE